MVSKIKVINNIVADTEKLLVKVQHLELNLKDVAEKSIENSIYVAQIEDNISSIRTEIQLLKNGIFE